MIHDGLAFQNDGRVCRYPLGSSTTPVALGESSSSPPPVDRRQCWRLSASQNGNYCIPSIFDPSLRQKFWPPPAETCGYIRQPPAEVWSTSGTLRQGNHHSPRKVNRSFWEGRGAHLETVAADEDWRGVVSAPHNRIKPNRPTTLTSGGLWHRNRPRPAASGKRLPSHPAAIGMPETRVKYDPKLQCIACAAQLFLHL